MYGDSFSLKANEVVIITKALPDFFEVKYGGLAGLFAQAHISPGL